MVEEETPKKKVHPKGRMRSIRIDDRTWERANEIARMQNTTVSDIIRGYLRDLRTNHRLNPSQLQGQRPVRKKSVVELTTAQLRELKKVCPHPEDQITAVALGKFCGVCGGRINEPGNE
ncbi:MAG: hypothetical protein KGL39_04440 [Patescibacteria group bacterium]|nr:hypothetical protein [Patescibacteria group bacterium]